MRAHGFYFVRQMLPLSTRHLVPHHCTSRPFSPPTFHSPQEDAGGQRRRACCRPNPHQHQRHRSCRRSKHCERRARGYPCRSHCRPTMSGERRERQAGGKGRNDDGGSLPLQFLPLSPALPLSRGDLSNVATPPFRQIPQPDRVVLVGARQGKSPRLDRTIGGTRVGSDGRNQVAMSSHNMDNLKRLHLKQNQLPICRPDEDVGRRHERSSGTRTVDIRRNPCLTNLHV